MNEVYRLIGQVNIEPVLRELDRLEFIVANYGKTLERDGKYEQTVALGPFPDTVNKFVEDLNLGGEPQRMLLRSLPPGTKIPPHIDDWMPEEADWRRFQVPIVSDPRVRMRWPDDGIDIYLEPGHLYEVDFSKTHDVFNGSNIDRIHMQIDQLGATI